MSAPRIEVRSALLVSDSHLHEAQPALTQRFCEWITRACTAGPCPPETTAPDALLILGDLFDAWVGDDHLSAVAHGTGQQVVAALAAIERTGVRVYLMHGNRDFLLGSDMARACGAQLLEDPTVMQVDNGPAVVLTHGDQLCTEDHAYQQFRNQVRSAAWQQQFLAKPLTERLTIARELREQSEQAKSGKPMTIMDVTPRDCELLIQRLDADMLLHGHTHRPGCSTLPNGKVRWVLPDWEMDAQGQLKRGGGLWVDATGVRPVDGSTPH